MLKRMAASEKAYPIVMQKKEENAEIIIDWKKEMMRAPNTELLVKRMKYFFLSDGSAKTSELSEEESNRVEKEYENDRELILEKITYYFDDDYFNKIDGFAIHLSLYFFNLVIDIHGTILYFINRDNLETALKLGEYNEILIAKFKDILLECKGFVEIFRSFGRAYSQDCIDLGLTNSFIMHLRKDAYGVLIKSLRRFFISVQPQISALVEVSKARIAVKEGLEALGIKEDDLRKPVHRKHSKPRRAHKAKTSEVEISIPKVEQTQLFASMQVAPTSVDDLRSTIYKKEEAAIGSASVSKKLKNPWASAETLADKLRSIKSPLNVVSKAAPAFKANTTSCNQTLHN